MLATPNATSDRPTGEAVAALAAETDRVLREAKSDSLADRLEAELKRAPAAIPRVVVVGDANQGKSSLVNALLAAPGLSPVSASFATSTYIDFSYAESPRAFVALATADEPREIAVEEIAAYATVEGNPNNEKRVRSVLVGLPRELLRALVVVDTPGVGGLDEGHAALTLQALGSAQALIFVSDASSSLKRHELDFLHLAAERIGRVLFVITKKEDSDWEPVVAENREKIAIHAPRFSSCEMVAVSSSLAEQARTSGLPLTAKVRDRRESGIYAVESFLQREVVARAEQLHLANIATLCWTALRRVESSIVDRASALVADPGHRAELEEEEARLKRLAADEAEWQATLGAAIQAHVPERSNQLQHGISDIRNRYRRRIKQSSRDQLAAIPGQLDAELAALAGQLAETTYARLSEAVQKILVTVDAKSSLGAVVQELRAAPSSTEWRIDPPSQPELGVADKHTINLSALTGAGAVMTVARIAGVAVVGGTVLPGIAVASAGVLVYLTRRVRLATIAESDMLTWTDTQVTAAQSHISHDFSQKLPELQKEIRDAIRGHVAALRDAAAERVAAHATAVRAGEEALHADQQRAREQLVETRRLIDAAAQLGGQEDPR